MVTRDTSRNRALRGRVLCDAAMQEALGGVLFIDEAYALVQGGGAVPGGVAVPGEWERLSVWLAVVN